MAELKYTIPKPQSPSKLGISKIKASMSDEYEYMPPHGSPFSLPEFDVEIPWGPETIRKRVSATDEKNALNKIAMQISKQVNLIPSKVFQRINKEKKYKVTRVPKVISSFLARAVAEKVFISAASYDGPILFPKALEEMAKIGSDIAFKANPQNYSFERRSRADEYIKQLPHVRLAWSRLKKAQSKDEALHALMELKKIIRSGIECNFLNRIIDHIKESDVG